MIINTRFSKIQFLLLATICCCNFINGQDMLIGFNGDTVKCKVTRLDSNKVYIMTKTSHEPIEYSVARNTIKELIVPVLPDDPTRLMYENNIEKFSTTCIISGVGAAAGYTLSIIGINRLFNGLGPAIEDGDTDAFFQGFFITGIGLPLAITGTIIAFISLHKVIYNKQQLKKLYNLSFNLDYNTNYKGISISYRF